MLSLNIKNKTGCSLSPSLLNIVPEILARALKGNIMAHNSEKNHRWHSSHGENQRSHKKSRQLIIKFSKIIRCKINTEKSEFRKTVVCVLPACIYVCMLCVCPMPEEAREGVRPFGTGIKNCDEKKKKRPLVNR